MTKSVAGQRGRWSCDGRTNLPEIGGDDLVVGVESEDVDGLHGPVLAIRELAVRGHLGEDVEEGMGQRGSAPEVGARESSYDSG